jgi:uncharacterized coiled-coil protein SlyX
MRKLVVLILIALGVLLVTPAVASASTPTLKSLAKAVKALQKTEKSQAAAISSLSSSLTAAKQTIATQGSTLATLTAELAQARKDITTLQNAPPSGVSQADFDALAAKVTTAQGNITSLQGTSTSQGSAIAGLTSVVGADASHGLQKSVGDIAANPVLGLSWLPTYLSYTTNPINGVAGPNLVFQGCNVHVRSDSHESDGSGLGNLIVGWDEVPTTTQRTGSNNLVCGDFNNFSDYGCFVAGSYNTVSSTFASVSGGEFNTASDLNASVSGGSTNTASSIYSSVSGGYDNTASGSVSSVSGGQSKAESSQYGWMAGSYSTP